MEITFKEGMIVKFRAGGEAVITAVRSTKVAIGETITTVELEGGESYSAQYLKGLIRRVFENTKCPDCGEMIEKGTYCSLCLKDWDEEYLSGWTDCYKKFQKNEKAEAYETL